jgi:transcriptional regulator with XRE-family HTH domain
MADNTSDFFSAKAFHEASARSGMTKKAIAAALGVTPTTMSSLYSGRSTPSLKLLQKMVGFFGGELTDFLELPSKQRWELKHYRIAAGLTQAALAKRLGIAPSAVSGWELGKYPPGRTLFPKLAELYGVSELDIAAAARAAKPPESAAATLQLAESVLEFARSALELAGEQAMDESERRATFTMTRTRVEQALTLLGTLIPQLPQDARSRAIRLVGNLSGVHEAISSG